MSVTSLIPILQWEISSHTSLTDPSTVFLNFWHRPVCENPVTTLNRGLNNSKIAKFDSFFL